MKKTIITAIIISTLFGALLLSIPKKDLPTDQQWEDWMDEVHSDEPEYLKRKQQELDQEWQEYLEYERQLYKDIDAGLYD